MPARALAALALTLTVAALAGCGGASAGSGDLAWKGDPRVFVPETLPEDRILQGEVVNDSLREVPLVASELTLRDAEGDEVPGSAVFLAQFGRTFYDVTRTPLPPNERTRLGRDVRLRPGDAAPLTVSWHAEDGRPIAVDYGTGSLPIPD